MQSGTTLDTFETHTIYSRAYRLQLGTIVHTSCKRASSVCFRVRRANASPTSTGRQEPDVGVHLWARHMAAHAHDSRHQTDSRAARGVSEMTCSMPGAEAKQACNHVRPLTHARGRSTMHHVLYPCSCPRTCSPVAHDSSSSSETSASPFRYCGE